MNTAAEIIEQNNIEKVFVVAKTKTHLENICVASRRCTVKHRERKWLFIPYTETYYDLPEDYSYLEKVYMEYQNDPNYVSVNIVGSYADTSDKFTYSPGQDWILR